MKKLFIALSALLPIFSNSVSAQNWDSLENQKLTLVTYCPGSMEDNKFKPSEKWTTVNGDESILLSDDTLEWQSAEGLTTMKVQQDNTLLTVSSTIEGEKDIWWMHIFNEDSKLVFVWCSDGVLRAFEK